MFIVKKDVVKTKVVVLTTEQKKRLPDLYLQTSGDVTATKHLIGKIRVSSSLILQSFNIKKAIFNHVKQLMTGAAVVSPAVYDQEGVKKQDVVYNIIPTTKTELLKEAYKWFPDCVKEPFGYNIDMIVKYADGTGTCSWEKFITLFKEEEL